MNRTYGKYKPLSPGRRSYQAGYREYREVFENNKLVGWDMGMIAGVPVKYGTRLIKGKMTPVKCCQGKGHNNRKFWFGGALICDICAQKLLNKLHETWER